MQPRQHFTNIHPDQQPTQTKATRPQVPHANRFNGCNYSFKTAELRAHNFRFLAALNLPPTPRSSQTYSQNSAGSRCNSAGVQRFLPAVLAQKPMTNRQFRYPLPESLNVSAIEKTFAVQTLIPPLSRTLPQHAPAHHLHLYLQPTGTLTNNLTATSLVISTHLRMQGCARKMLHPCILETSPARPIHSNRPHHHQPTSKCKTTDT